MQRQRVPRSAPSVAAGLTPVPREVSGDGEPLAFRDVEVSAPSGWEQARRLLADELERPGRALEGSASGGTSSSGTIEPLTVTIDVDTGLPPEGCTLDVAPAGEGPTATIRAADPAGAFYGARTLVELVRQRPGHVPRLTVRDWPGLEWRGTVEGFYGPPWTHADRLEHLRFAGRHKLNHFVYAPKDDPFHRDRWREPYPPEELARLAELTAAARAQHVRFVYALSPGLSMRYCDPREHELLRAKTEQLWDIGVRDFALLFDDIPTELTHPGDRARFGKGTGAAGAAHGYTCAQFVEHFLAPRTVSEPLLMVPTDYAGTTTSRYREHLAATLPADALVWWTGRDIVVGEVTRQDIDAAAASYGRRLLLWDNFPVNDFDRTRLFLGPLTGRTTRLEGSALAGISANPMIEEAPSQLALAAVADYAWNPAAYDPAASASRSLAAVAGPAAEAIAPLVHACSAWPPGAAQDARLVELSGIALGPDRHAARTAADEIHAALAGLEAVHDAVTDTATDAGVLVRQLEPWIVAGTDMARAGRRGVELLLARLDGADQGTGRDGTGVTDLVASAEAALDAAERHYPNVLREVVPPFVRAVLRPARASAPGAPAGPWAMIVTAPEPEAGEETFARALRRRGLEVRFSATGDLGEHDPTHPASLVVVARSADPAAAATAGGAPVPLLAWAHLIDAGLATESAVILVDDRVDVVAPEDPLAAGFSGRVTVYRGPGKVTWGEPAAGATVVARTVEGARPAIFRYPAGATLADGSAAAAPRIGIFLGRPALAPWLLSADGLALVDAALTELVGGVTGRTVTGGELRSRAAGTAGSRPG
ncbi:hypothetical protein GCM10023169_21320 [Georgenia halophila]|uniref:GH84 domain-containing protein n=1 Tax=Georgenia halophila TaxID=620889 RepID=A0ABP8L7X1_9MICO